MPGDGLLRILFIEDVPQDADLAARELRTSGLSFTWARVDSSPDLHDALRTRGPDLVVCDYAMPGFSWLQALSAVIAHDPALPFIVLTGSQNEETAVSCLKAGAWDYVLKDHVSRLPFAVRDALARKQALVEASRAREALAESERRYRTLADSGRALIWTGRPDMTCDYVNQPWLDFTGRTLEQEMSPDWIQGVHPDDRIRCLEAYRTAFSERRPFSTVFRLLRHDGEYRSVREDGTPRYDSHGNFLGYIGQCLDITDLLRAEQEVVALEAGLARAQRMEAVGRLAAGVSHEFNNVLTGILGFCDLLLSSMPPDAPYRADVQQIQAVAQRASTLSRQLLAFSRQQKVQQTPLNLTTLMSDIRKTLRTVVHENVELVWDLASDLDDVNADPGQIEQAVYNLVTNAGDAMPGGGRLTIRTARATLDEDFVAAHPGARAGRYVALSVADTGTGIDARLLPLVFEPFITTKPEGEGTGLGLAAVYGIVKQSGGYVTAESDVGRGSTFTLYFPVSGGAVVEAAPGPAPPEGGARSAGTILLVEDDATLRALLRRALEGSGYTTIEAADGHEALARWKDAAARIDLLVTDIVMPGRSGLDLARLCRDARPALPVVFMSGYAEPAVFERLPEDEYTDVLRKPFLRRQLIEKIRQLLDRQGASPPRDR